MLNMHNIDHSNKYRHGYGQFTLKLATFERMRTCQFNTAIKLTQATCGKRKYTNSATTCTHIDACICCICA